MPVTPTAPSSGTPPHQPRWRSGVLGLGLWALVVLGLTAQMIFTCTFRPEMVDHACWTQTRGQIEFIAFVVGAMLAVMLALYPVLPQHRPRWRVTLLTLAMFVAGMLTGAALSAWHGVFNGPPSAGTLQMVLLQAVLLAAGYDFFRRGRTQRHEAAHWRIAQQQLATQIDAARLQLLTAQVEPHFLFNTLAHLRRLAQTDPPGARAMLADLLQYLHQALPELSAPDTTLARELRLVRAYLALHERRMGLARLRVQFDIEPGLDDLRLPSSALLTLAENAIKHGLAPQVQGGELRVQAKREGNDVLLSVADTGRGMTEASGHGTGLATLRARLRAMHGEAASLSLALNQPQGLVVSLRLPWPA